MKYLSVCSGIEAASVAWHPLGWEPLAFSEIEKFPRKVLTHHYPDVPLHGDFTVLREQDWIKDADILVGGTPCQAFSVAGLRNSLDDDRGNLTLEFVRLADAIDNLRRIGTIIVWENVPGVLSVKDNAFGCFLAALVGNNEPLIPTGGKWTNAGMVMGPKRRAAWRVLDAQYFGVAQRRRRVFVVASARDDFDPAEVLFEREGLRRNTPPCREAVQAVAATTAQCFDRQRSDEYGEANIASTMSARDYKDATDPVAQPIAFNSKDYGSDATTDMSPTLRSLGAYDANGGGSMAVAQPIPLDTMNIIERPSDKRRANRIGRGYGEAGDPMFTITKGHSHAVAQPIVVHGTQDPCVSDIAFAQGRNNGAENVLVQAIALAENTIGRKPENGGNGDGFIEGGPMYTPNATEVHGVAIGTDCYNGTITGDISMTLKCGDGNPAINLPTVMQPICLMDQGGSVMNIEHDMTETLRRETHGHEPVVMQPTAYASSDGKVRILNDVMSTLDSAGESRGTNQQRFIHQEMAVRRLTPRECERLQGFPDDYTNIPSAADGPRYKALGNSMAVPVMAWIGKRIDREHR